MGDNCWMACGKTAGKCFDEETGKGFCGEVSDRPTPNPNPNPNLNLKPQPQP